MLYLYYIQILIPYSQTYEILPAWVRTHLDQSDQITYAYLLSFMFDINLFQSCTFFFLFTYSGQVFSIILWRYLFFSFVGGWVSLFGCIFPLLLGIWLSFSGVSFSIYQQLLVGHFILVVACRSVCRPFPGYRSLWVNYFYFVQILCIERDSIRIGFL